jgi:hypothetical protein
VNLGFCNELDDHCDTLVNLTDVNETYNKDFGFAPQSFTGTPLTGATYGPAFVENCQPKSAPTENVHVQPIGLHDAGDRRRA